MPKTREKVELFELHLDNGRTMFIPGQRVEGHISLILKEPVFVNKLRVRFYGKAISNLQKKGGIMNESSSVTLFKDNAYLIGSRNEEGDLIAAGESVYPFQFRMPGSSLEASYEGEYGCVRYWIEALLDYGVRSTTITEILTVPSSKNVNDAEYNTGPIICTKGSAGLLFFSKDFEVDASLPRSAYASETNSPLSIKLKNKSKYGIFIQSISLKQKVTYFIGDR